MRTKKWYVIYTKSRAEKKVRDQLIQNGIECFLPLQKTLRQWSDRKKFVEVPLFNSYVFVRINDHEFNLVKKIKGVVDFISFNGKNTSVSDQEINNIKLALKGQVQIEIGTENFELGDLVEVDRGPFIGLRGFLIKTRGKHKVLIKIEIINQNILLEIPVAFLRKVYYKSA